MSSSASPQKRQTSEGSPASNKRAKVADINLDGIESQFSIDELNNSLNLPNIDSTVVSPSKIEASLLNGSSQVPSSSGSTPNPELLIDQTINQLQLPDLVQTTTPTGAWAANNKTDDKDELLQKPQAPADPDKLSDALLSAGVDLKAEEALLTSTVNNQLESTKVNNQPIILNTPFLDPRQLATFMNKEIRAHGLSEKNFFDDTGILELVTNACEEWMKNIVTNAVIISRHRRRSVKNRKRSEICKALRDISLKQKSQEDKREQKKKNFGLDNNDKEKEGTEEIQHKATNATVAMMAGGKKKKYSWMTGGSAGSGSKNSSGGSDSTIRFREAREEPGITVRDLLTGLEKKRIGVEKTLVKGYAKLKD